MSSDEKEIKKEKREPRLYKDFNDYWRNGNHGCSSYSRDIVEDTWQDLEPTIMANRGDWENLLVEECIQQRKWYIEELKEIHIYLDEFKLEKHAGINFPAWRLGRITGKKHAKDK